MFTGAPPGRAHFLGETRPLFASTAHLRRPATPHSAPCVPSCSVGSGLEQLYGRLKRGVANRAREASSFVGEQGRAAGQKARQSAASLDSTFQLRHRARALALDGQRAAEQGRRLWLTRLSKEVRQAVLLTLLFGGFYTGLLGRVLGFALKTLLVVWWLSPLVMLTLGQSAARQAQYRETVRRSNAARSAARGNPFSGPWGQPFGPRDAGFRQPPPRGVDYRQGGPVIDAEWTTIDEADS